MTKQKAIEILREFVARFERVCPDMDGKIDPADAKRIKQALNAISTLSCGPDYLTKIRQKQVAPPEGEQG